MNRATLTPRAYVWRYHPQGPLFRMWSDGKRTEARKEPTDDQ